LVPEKEQLEWLDGSMYPFTSKLFSTSAGEMHYLDEGAGDPIVMVHGNPSWSFEFRNLIKIFSPTHRCIAPDHLGFGLSDKPEDWSYLPKAHADNLKALLNSLDLRNITLVVGDWGGPIGLSYALLDPARIKNILITNTWMWSVRDDWYYQLFSKFTGGILGKFLIKQFNFFARTILWATYGDKGKLTPEVHRHYLEPFENKNERKGNWVFPWQITASSNWLESLWKQRNKLQDKNILIAWGMKDIAFREKELKRWKAAFPQARVITYPEVGHFVIEEEPQKIAREMQLKFFSIDE
jgi:haloalkane dehalogenase